MVAAESKGRPFGPAGDTINPKNYYNNRLQDLPHADYSNYLPLRRGFQKRIISLAVATAMASGIATGISAPVAYAESNHTAIVKTQPGDSCMPLTHLEKGQCVGDGQQFQGWEVFVVLGVLGTVWFKATHRKKKK